MISFDNVSPSARASHAYIELAGKKRSLASFFIPPIGGVVGTYDPAKSSTVDYAPVKVTSANEVGGLFGFGSHIHRQALRFPASVYLQGGGVYAFPIPEAAGTAATANITFTTTATSNGTFFFSVGGVPIEVPVLNGALVADVAQDLDDAITAERDIAVTAVATNGACAITAKFKGTAGNQILLVINPEGKVQEDQNPSGMTVAISTGDGYLATGATDPDVEDMFFDANGADVLGDRWYTAFTMPWTDATNLAWYKASALARSLPGVNRMFGAYHGYAADKTLAQALTTPATINDKFIGTIWDDRYQAPAFELAAELTGIILDEQNKAPNRPYKTLALAGQSDSTISNRKTVENDALFRAGMSYCNIGTDGVMRLGDVALTYRTDANGGASEEWYDAVTLSCRQAKAYSLEQLFLQAKYARGVAVDDAAVTAVDYAIAPKDVVADIVKLIEDLWVPYAWTKNAEDVIASITAEINESNNSRIDAEVTDDQAQALRIIAMKYAYLY